MEIPIEICLFLFRRDAFYSCNHRNHESLIVKPADDHLGQKLLAYVYFIPGRDLEWLVGSLALLIILGFFSCPLLD